MRRHGFRARGRSVELRLDDNERSVLADLLRQLVAIVEPDESQSQQDPLAAAVGIAESAPRPTDPALLRLLPDGYRDDDSSAADFRRFTEASLRKQKADNAEQALASLGDAEPGESVTLTKDQGLAWMTTLNDLRLIIGTRLEVTEEGVSHARPEGVLYDWLTWLQSTCIDAMDKIRARLR